jgi:hypothetical protein
MRNPFMAHTVVLAPKGNKSVTKQIGLSFALITLYVGSVLMYYLGYKHLNQLSF